MRYHVLHIETHFAADWQEDIFHQNMAEHGIETIDGSDYYLQTPLWEQNQDAILSLCNETKGVHLLSVEACPDENWNAAWEADHPMEELPLGIRIAPHCAFGAGHHETTAMMIAALRSARLTGKQVMDHGTGTGVLAIFAKRLGADYVLAIDIDEKSLTNALENAALNGETIDVKLADRPPVSTAQFDLILANIHRNVLLANLAGYAACLKSGGQLWLSGFYEEDCGVLISAAETNGMKYLQTVAEHEWRMLQLIKN